jgi:hypothetical protein
MGKPKKVNYRLIGKGSPLYPMMDELIGLYHEELAQARIALAWNLSWKPDVDGRVTLGKCKKASDLDRELAAYDFVIILRQEFFEDAEVTDAQRRALLDHELCHAAPKLDEDGEQLEDEKGRKVWRTRKHDIEEFEQIVARHGCYKRDLERFAAALKQSKQGKLPLAEDVPGVGEMVRDPKFRKAVDALRPKAGSGIESVSITSPGHEPVVLRPKGKRLH